METQSFGAERLRELLSGGEIIVAPGAYDGVTARIVEKCGFHALYMTGSGVSLSTLGVADIGTVSMAEQLTRARQIVSAVGIPLIADIDTGYGGPLNIIRTIREFEKAGVAGVHIEDQANPKRCGHEFGRRIISAQEMVKRINACREARKNSNFVIIARTDSRTEYGIDEAIRRGNLYAEAGADVVFIESPESMEELRRIPLEVRAPVMCNMVEGGRTPLVETSLLQEYGFSIVIFPNTLTRTFVKQGVEVLSELRERKTTQGFRDKMVGHGELFAFFDYEKHIEQEKAFS